jgi:hypothetical protein
VRLIAPNGELPDINYVEARGADGSYLSEQGITPGVFRIQVFPGTRYEMQGSRPTKSRRRLLAWLMEETGSNELALTFPGPGCPKKTDSEEDNDGSPPGLSFETQNRSTQVPVGISGKVPLADSTFPVSVYQAHDGEGLFGNILNPCGV